MPPCGAVGLLLLSALVAAPQERYARPDPYESSIRTLREAARLPSGAARSPALLALIALEDPDLRPLFQSLVQHPDRPVMQADAIVGIASADPNGTIDAFTLRQITDKELRSEVLKTLIGRGLIKPAEINQILRWPDGLLPEDSLFLVATLEREGAPWQPADLDPVAETTVAELRALRAILLLEKGDAKSWESLRQDIALMPKEDRNALLAALAPAVRSYRLEQSIGPLLRLAADRDIDPNVRAAVVGSALDLDAKAGMDVLRQEVDEDRSQPNLLRYCLLALVVSEKPGVDPELFKIFEGSGSKELDALAAAGVCSKGGAGCADAFKRVIDLGFRPAAEWCIQRASELSDTDPDLSRAVMNHVLDLAAQARDPRETIVLLAVKAAEELILLDPDSLRERLLNSPVPVPIIEAISLAMVDAAKPMSSRSDRSDPRADARREAAATLATSVRSKLARRYDSMALVAMARAGRPLSAQDLEQLGAIASGGGRVDEGIQVQAAWLYLKAHGRHQEAIARISPE